jgi:hypothetical protein
MTAAAPVFKTASIEVDDPDAVLVMPDDIHVDSTLTEKQERLLTEPLYSSWSGPPPAEDGVLRSFAVLANAWLFSSLSEPPILSDVLLSLDVTIPVELKEKKNPSYRVWHHGHPPDVVIEFVSTRSRGELDERVRRCRRMSVAYYIVCNPLSAPGDSMFRTLELQGCKYVAIERPWFEVVGLGLVEWEGTFEGLQGRWLRWCRRDGELVQTGAERASRRG